MYANSQGSGETVQDCVDAQAHARMRRLAWAFPGRLCDKYHNLMSWLTGHAQRSGMSIVCSSNIRRCLSVQVILHHALAKSGDEAKTE